MIIEVKYTNENHSLDSACKDALEQIKTKDYIQTLKQDGMQKILKYGIAFQFKKCRVMIED